MKIDFKDKRVGIPIIAVLGAIFFTIVIYINYFKDDDVVVVENETEVLKPTVGEVSDTEADRSVDNKFQAYDAHVRDQKDKYTAIQDIKAERQKFFSEDYYTDEEKDRLDEEAAKIAAEREREALDANNAGSRTKKSYNNTSGYKNINSNEKEFEQLLTALDESNKSFQNQAENNTTKEPSAFEDMRKQYLFLDSLERANNPDLLASQREEERDRRILDAIERNKLSRLTVQKVTYNKEFNSIKRQSEGEFIKAVIDENITGYAGSRLRLRLLEDIQVGKQILRKNTYLYAIITGFNEQRVILTISSIMYENQILPIKLKIYDNDGLEGLYVPASQFREFTKEIGEAGIQSVGTQQMGDGENQNQFYMSMISRMFQSTTSAITKLIRKNKVRFKYNSFIYLVDEKALEETKKNIYEKNKNQ